MGASDAGLISKNPEGKVIIPDVINQDSANAAAAKILGQSDIDKATMQLLPNQPSSDTITFHNGVTGQVTVELGDVPKLPGLQITVDKPTLTTGEDAKIQAHYDPPADRDPDKPLPGLRFMVNIHPFEQIFVIQLGFQAADKE
jgi:hypothetical protein